MTEIIGVRFKGTGKVYYFAPNDVVAKQGDKVIVETAQGLESAVVTIENKQVEDSEIVAPLKKVIRKATEQDFKIIEENVEKEKSAFAICQKKIEKHKLDMKLTSVEYSFDGTKILFYFTADGRVDFRELVKDLASEFHTRIELRQIGVRDEAKMLGGLGICGQPFCCHRFLDDFHPVSIKMAKEQGLAPNPLKISGSCGRLMCCLKYEQESYEYLSKKMPRHGQQVSTPDGVGVVADVQLLRGTVRVKFEQDGDIKFVIYDSKDVKVRRQFNDNSNAKKQNGKKSNSDNKKLDKKTENNNN